MKPEKIILVRHSESEANVDKTIQEIKPDYACELTEKGKQQAIDLGKDLSFLLIGSVQFYCSPYWRTRQTYLGINQSIQEWRYYEDPRLREQEWGTELAPKDYELDKRRDSYGHFYYRIAGGESCADVYDRVSDFMNTMWRDFQKTDYPKNVIIVNHGMTMRIFLMRMFHWTVEQFEILANPPNCAYVVLELDARTDRYILKTELKKYPSYNHTYQFNWEEQRHNIKKLL